MKQITDESELIGKTIERTKFYDDNLFMFFTDKTFCMIFVSKYGGETDVDIDRKFDTIASEGNYNELFNLGFINEDEFNKWRDLYIERRKKIKEEQEIQKLKELREKYPNV